MKSVRSQEAANDPELDIPEDVRDRYGLVRAMLDHRELQGISLFLLRTRDAHGLYTQFGFTAVDKPEELMARGRLNERTEAEPR